MSYLKYYLTITVMFGAACFFFYHSIYPVGDNREFSKSNSQLFTGRVSHIKCMPVRGGADNLTVAWRAEDKLTQFNESIQLSEGCGNYPLKSMNGGQITIRVQGSQILAFSVNTFNKPMTTKHPPIIKLKPCHSFQISASNPINCKP